MRDHDDHEIVNGKPVLKNGRRIGWLMYLTDAQREIAADGLSIADHRPGYRVSVDHAALDRAEAAWHESNRRTAKAWKSDALRKADSEAAAEGGPNAAMAADDAQAIRDLAYASYVQRVTNAWRGGAA
jgi:hypothetical protein